MIPAALLGPLVSSMTTGVVVGGAVSTNIGIWVAIGSFLGQTLGGFVGAKKEIADHERRCTK